MISSNETLKQGDLRPTTQVLRSVTIENITSQQERASEQVLTPGCLEFLSELHNQFHEPLMNVLLLRKTIEDEIRETGTLSLPRESIAIRHDPTWRCTSTPSDLTQRHVEITGPADPKMMINALNSGADVFMADLEDSLSPTWTNILTGHQSLNLATHRALSYQSPDGRTYSLQDRVATLVVRPRGLHLREPHLKWGGVSMAGSWFDAGIYLYHNAHELLKRGSGPYFYLPKIEHYREARLWAEFFRFSERKLGLPPNSVKATVLIETISAAHQMDEILFELRDYVVGLNAGRWDYIFSAIKKFASQPDLRFPDRTLISMTVPFMEHYSKSLVNACHKRGAHAIGGMAAFIPSRRNAEINSTAFAKVFEDKSREATLGFDGTWVAHPDLVAVARRAFSQRLGQRPHQKDCIDPRHEVNPHQLTDFEVPLFAISTEGFRSNIEVALRYIEAWLEGQGAVAIHNLMEDVATAEISRSLLWLWVQRHARLTAKNHVIDEDLYFKEKEFIIANILKDREAESDSTSLFKASDILDQLVLSAQLAEFLTLTAMPYLETTSPSV